MRLPTLNRRHAPTALALLAALILAWYLVYSQMLVRELRRDAQVHSRMVVRVYGALSDTAWTPWDPPGPLGRHPAAAASPSSTRTRTASPPSG